MSSLKWRRCIADPLEKSILTQAEYFKDIVGTIREPLLVLDASLRVLAANRSFYKFFKVKAGVTIGCLVYDLGDRQWDIHGLRLLLETILPQKTTFNDYNVEHDFPVIGRRILLLNARRIPKPPKEAQWILLAFEDVTQRMELERSLLASEQRFHAAFETASDSMLLVDKISGKVLNSNRAAQDSLGYSNRKLLKKNLWELGILKDRRQFRRISIELEKQGVVGLVDTTIPTSQGGDYPADLTIMDRLEVIQCNIRDISERKQTEKGLRESEERYQMLMDTIPDGVVVHSQGRIIYANPASAKIGGVASPAELIGRPVLDFVHPDFRKKALTRIQQAMAGTPSPIVEEKFIRPDGAIIDVQVTTFPVSYVDEPAVLTVFSDITERKQTESLLHKSEQQLRLITDNMHDIVIRTDLQGLILYASPSHQKVLGIRPEKMVGTSMYALMHPEDVERVQAFARSSLRKGEPGAQEFRYRHADGHYLLLESTGVIFFDENGMPAGVVLSSHDITKRKLAEDKLAASENELRALFAAMTDVVFVLDGEGRYLKIAPTNPLNLYRLPEDMLGKTIHEILPKEIADYMLAKIGEAIQTNQAVPGEYALQIDGKEIWFASSTSRLSDNSVIWVAHDITERKLAEKELEKRTNFLDKLIESSALSTWISDEQGTVIRTNPACLKFFGAAEEEVIGKYNVFQDGVIQKQGFMPDIKKVFEKGEVANIILDYDFGAVDHVSVRNATHKYINAIFTPILDDTGKVTNVVVQSIDLSEIRKAEEEILQLNSRLELRVEERTRQLREAQEELVRKEKLAVLGQLAGGVGHELRNPLGVISNSVYYLKMVQPDANEKIRKHHAMIEQELHNATRIVSDLLDYAREISTEPQPGSVTGLVEHTLSRFPVPASIGIKINIPAGLPQVYADPLHVEQILGNLVTNACQAMSLLSLDMKAGSIPVSISEKLTITARQKKNMLAIAVKDTGSGITPENMQKLFEPLFSTKAKGIGLGLVVSKKLAEANGGRIEVKSQPGKGSTFTLYLPVSS